MHWTNSNFQIEAFIAGSCHTADEAYRKLCELRDDRRIALEQAGAGKAKHWQEIACIEAAEQELGFINELLKKIEPFRKYAHLTDAEAHQACQREEWKLEFIRRAENCLLTQGVIPTDQFASMRLHPDFVSAIEPRIKAVALAIRDGINVPMLPSPANLIISGELIEPAE